jgi:hypothetical protein
MVTSCLEQGTKSTVKKTRNVCAGLIVIHAVNTDLVVMPRGISHSYIIVNMPFKNHLKQLYSEWLLAGHCVLTPPGTIKKPSIELLCQWVKFMATDLSRSGNHRILKVVMCDEMYGRMRKKLGMLAVNIRVRWKLCVTEANMMM